MESLWQDIRYGTRMMLRSPGFTAVAILALALGIGANTLMFSVVDTVLLRPLPYRDADALFLTQMVRRETGRSHGAAAPDFYTARARNRSFEHFAAYYQRPVNISGSPRAERTQSLIVSSEFFDVLRVAPVLGRSFVSQDEQWGQHRVVLLSDGLWRRRYGADKAIVGQTITLNAEPHTVIGVLPPGLSFAGLTIGLYLPMSFAPADNMNSHSNYFLTMLGRTKPGVGREQALADLDGIARAIEQEFPENRGLTFSVTGLHDSLVQEVKPALWVLMGAVGFVLLIACANLANLLLARAAGRSREIAVRAALGARRSRLLRQFLTESLLLALCGGAAGLAFAYWGTTALHLVSPRVLPRVQEVDVDPRVLGFTLAVSVLTGMLFGLAPALHGLRFHLHDALKAGTRAAGGGGGRLRSALVVTEVALSLVLLVGAGLMLKSMQRLTSVDPGFDPQAAVSTFINLPAQKYVDTALERQFSPDAYAKATRFFDELIARVRALPGVTAVGAISNLPLTGEAWGKTLTVYDRPLPATLRDLPSMQYRVVAGDYFRALGIRVLEGRVFNDRDTAASPKVVVINRELARRFWEGKSALGKEVTVNPPLALIPPGIPIPPEYRGPDKFTVIGVVDDVHYGTLQSAPPPLVYALHSQGAEGTAGMHLVVRTGAGPSALASALREQVAQMDPDVPVGTPAPLESVVAAQMAQPKLQMVLLGSFALLAVVLAAIGLYAVISYGVTQRTREIGIRMALGAARGDVFRIVLGQGLRLGGIGLLAGLGGALGLTRLMRSLLFNVSTTDPAVFAGIAGLLAAIAVLAGYFPARRATRVDPMVALRYE